MAKLIGPLNSVEARGRVDALVYGTWRGIRYVKSYTPPAFADPDPRAAQNVRVAAANSAWKLLSNEQRRAWHDYAQAHPRLDWSGVQVRITGYNAWISCFTILTRVGVTPPSLPPTTAPPLPLSTVVSSQTDNDIEIAWTYPTQPTGHAYWVQIWKSGPWSLGKIPDFHRAAIVTHSAIAASPYTDSVAQNGRYGYWARVVDGATGETTPWLRCQTDWVYAPPPTPYNEGPLSPGTVADLPGIGTVTWSNPEYAKTSNNTYAQALLPALNSKSHYLYASNFAFSAGIHDDATIVGIVVEIERHCAVTGVRDYLSPKLVDATGAVVGTSHATGIAWPTVDPNTYVIYGSSTDLWGVSGLTGADVKNSNFGVALSATQLGFAGTAARVDHIRMTIYCTNP